MGKQNKPSKKPSTKPVAGKSIDKTEDSPKPKNKFMDDDDDEFDLPIDDIDDFNSDFDDEDEF